MASLWASARLLIGASHEGDGGSEGRNGPGEADVEDGAQPPQE